MPFIFIMNSHKRMSLFSFHGGGIHVRSTKLRPQELSPGVESERRENEAINCCERNRAVYWHELRNLRICTAIAKGDFMGRVACIRHRCIPDAFYSRTATDAYE